MIVRYMGTKRHMARHVRSAIGELRPQGRIVDLFSGMGSVAESLQDQSSVVTNDLLGFTVAISRARFTGATRTTSRENILSRLKPAYLAHTENLSVCYAEQLKIEDAALAGSREGLTEYMASALHAGNDNRCSSLARQASRDNTDNRYCLASLYFSAGYFSLRQAIEWTEPIRPNHGQSQPFIVVT